jgi:signal recognition particle subunit SRP54
VGEKVSDFEPYYPDRLASRILGMGDVLTFIEKAEKTFDQKRVKELEKKVKTASFTLEDFLDQLGEIQKMGPVAQLVEMLPGASQLAKGMPDGMQEKQLRKVEAMIRSMTPQERQNPNLIDGSRRRRIARGSGVMTQEVNQLLNQFRQMQKLMKMGAKGKLPGNLKGLFG